MKRLGIRQPLWLVVLMSMQAHAQSASPTFPNPGKTSMSKENQHALGMEVAAQVYQQMPVPARQQPGIAICTAARSEAGVDDSTAVFLAV